MKLFKILITINIWLLAALATVHTFRIREIECKVADIEDNKTSFLKWLIELDHKLSRIDGERDVDDGK